MRYKTASGVVHDLSQDGSLPGLITPDDHLWTATSFVVVAGRAHFHRFEVHKTIPVALMAYSVSIGATNDDQVECGIYDSTGTKIDSSGLVSGKLNGAAAVKTVTVAETLPPGVYYAAFLCPAVGGTGATVTAAGLVNALVMQLFGTTAPTMLACQMAAQATLPTTIVPSFATANTPILAVRSA